MCLRRRQPATAVAVLAVLSAVAVALSGCGSSGSPETPPSATPATDSAAVAVVASTNVHGSIVEAVGGDRVTVTAIIDSPEADPHEYEATPADSLAVNDAKIVVVNGGGYDEFATRLVDAAATKPTVVNVVELSGLQPSATGEQAPEFNEHVWYSLPAMKRLAEQLATDLAAVDPAHAAVFAQNAATFNARIDALIGRLDAIKAAHSGDKIAVTEPVPLYLVQDAGLVNATPEEFSKAVEEGSDPPAAVVNEMLELFTGKQVKVLLANAQTETASTRQVEQAATAAGIPQVSVTETLPVGVEDYLTWQDRQIAQLASALDQAA